MPEFLISNRASEASEKISEKMWGKSYRPLAQWKWNAITLVTSDCSYMCTTKKYGKKSTPWPWAYFTNGPNAAASIAPTLIRHCVCSFIHIIFAICVILCYFYHDWLIDWLIDERLCFCYCTIDDAFCHLLINFVCMYLRWQAWIYTAINGLQLNAYRAGLSALLSFLCSFWYNNRV